VQDTYDRYSLPINLIEDGMRSKITPPISFANVLNRFAELGIASQGVETSDHCITIVPRLLDAELADGVLGDVCDIVFGSFR
jgi:hypothetical protein